MGVAGSLGARAAAVGADLSNQMGVGHGNYVPDFATSRGSDGTGRDPASRGELDPPSSAEPPTPAPGAGGPGGAATPAGPAPQPPAGASAGAGAGAGGGVAAAGGAAAAVPIVPV